MNSIWSETANKPLFERLEKDVKTDVLVIGGGIAGIMCAYMLIQAGVDCILVEGDRICGGITKNTTAKITLQHGLIYHKIAEKFDIDTARLYYKSQKAALEEYRRLCEKFGCDYENTDSYVYSIDDRKKIEREVRVLESIGCNARLVNETPLPFAVAGAVRISGQAQFHPLKFLYPISKQLRIYENTQVTRLIRGGAITPRGTVKCKKTIVATHFPFLNKHGSYFLKLYQHRSYVMALENAPDLMGIYVDDDIKGMSFRSYKGKLLLGGGGHRTGKTGGGWSELKLFAQKHYPQAKITDRWATQDCMTLDSVPYIGQYSKHTPDMYVATGFNKWGMTGALVSAKLLTDMILGKANEASRIYSPSRSILRPQLAINAAESLIGLLTPTAPRCSHMGCALKYNRQEHSWDCSCHGSRYDEKGHLIDNPAAKDIKNPPRTHKYHSRYD